MAEIEKKIEESKSTEIVEDSLAELKAFMGNSYKDGLTLNDVSSFLKGKKYADLNSGNYVGKKKFEDLEKKHNDYLESTKDYDTLKTELETYKTAEKKEKLKKQALDVKIDEKFVEFALSQIDTNAKDLESELKEWLKKNPQFRTEEKRIFFETNPNHENGSKPNQNINAIINENIRKATGRKD